MSNALLIQALGAGFVMKKITNLRKEDEGLDLHPAAWTQEEVDAMHQMVRKYMWAEQFKKISARWIVWGLGIPAAAMYFLDPMERMAKFLKGLLK